MAKAILEIPLLFTETEDQIECPECGDRDLNTINVTGNDEHGSRLFSCNDCGCLFMVNEETLVKKSEMMRLLNRYEQELERHGHLSDGLRQRLHDFLKECQQSGSHDKWSDSKLLANIRFFQGGLFAAGLYSLEALQGHGCCFEKWRGMR